MRSQWRRQGTEMGSPTDGQSGLARRRWGGGKESEMNGSIVCGVDESADSQAALGVAARLAERLDARLADLADEEDAELIVVGSRGRGRFKAAFLGSVSNSLVGVARCPVLIVPPGAGQERVFAGA